MCYSNCSFENFHGVCNNPTKYGMSQSADCFEGFTCLHCSDIIADTEEMSDIENVCNDCLEHYTFDKKECSVCNTWTQNQEIDNTGTCSNCLDKSVDKGYSID